MEKTQHYPGAIISSEQEFKSIGLRTQITKADGSVDITPEVCVKITYRCTQNHLQEMSEITASLFAEILKTLPR